MSLVQRDAFRTPVKMQDCKGSRIYCDCVLYLNRNRNRTSAPSAETCLDMSVAMCLPLRPDLQFLLSPMTLSHIPEKDIVFIDHDSDEMKTTAAEADVKEAPESGTRRVVSPNMLRCPRYRQRLTQIEACGATHPLRK